MECLINGEVNAKKITKFVTPSVIMLIFIALYYMVDAVFVANFISSDALAAVNIVYPISGLGWGLSIMLAAGSSSIVAINMGEGNMREAGEKFTLICLFSTGIGVVAAVFGILFLDVLIEQLGATEILRPYCRDYAWILIAAMPSAFVGVLMEYFIRVDGKPGFTLFLYTSGGLVHIILDFLFIVILDWGIKGAGWACAAGQITVMLLGIAYFLTRDTNLRFIKPQWDWGYLKRCIGNGSSEMVSESSTAATVYVFNLIVVGVAGENGLAALSIVFNIHYLLISVHLGFITGIAPLISYYYGARDYDTVNYSLWYSKVFIIVSSAVVALCALVGAPILVRIFIESGSEVYDMAVRGIRFLSVAFLFTGINIFASGFFTAYANGAISAIISVSRGLILVLIGAAIFPGFLGLDGVWATPVFAEIATLFLTIFLINRFKSVYHYDFSGKEG